MENDGSDDVQIDASLPVEKTPDEAGKVEADGLEQQDERHPLVVDQLLLIPAKSAESKRMIFSSPKVRTVDSSSVGRVPQWAGTRCSAPSSSSPCTAPRRLEKESQSVNLIL